MEQRQFETAFKFSPFLAENCFQSETGNESTTIANIRLQIGKKVAERALYNKSTVD